MFIACYRAVLAAIHALPWLPQTCWVSPTRWVGFGSGSPWMAADGGTAVPHLARGAPSPSSKPARPSRDPMFKQTCQKLKPEEALWDIPGVLGGPHPPALVLLFGANQQGFVSEMC